MEKLFNWFGTLSNTEIIGYSFLVCGIMLFIPYSETFFKLTKKMVFMRRMSVKHFSYQFYPIEIIIENDGASVTKMIDTPDFVLENSKILLYWEVEGSLSVSLYPKHGKVKGNLAEVIVNRNHREFSLVVKGLFSRERIDINIPLEKIKTIETKEISETDIITQVPLVKSFSFSEGEVINNVLTQNTPLNLSFAKLPIRFTKNLSYQEPEILSKEKIEFKNSIESGKIMKHYSFSTKKYNKVNQFNNPNS
jgi:hypothetical protein